MRAALIFFLSFPPCVWVGSHSFPFPREDRNESFSIHEEEEEEGSVWEIGYEEEEEDVIKDTSRSLPFP